jgi:hypothetical protein
VESQSIFLENQRQYQALNQKIAELIEATTPTGEGISRCFQ